MAISVQDILNTSLPLQDADAIAFDNTISGINATTVQDAIDNLPGIGPPLFKNASSFSSNYTISSQYNALSVGPIAINTGVVVTVAGLWVIF